MYVIFYLFYFIIIYYFYLIYFLLQVIFYLIYLLYILFIHNYLFFRLIFKNLIYIFYPLGSHLYSFLDIHISNNHVNWQYNIMGKYNTIWKCSAFSPSLVHMMTVIKPLFRRYWSFKYKTFTSFWFGLNIYNICQVWLTSLRGVIIATEWRILLIKVIWLFFTY